MPDSEWVFFLLPSVRWFVCVFLFTSFHVAIVLCVAHHPRGVAITKVQTGGGDLPRGIC